MAVGLPLCSNGILTHQINLSIGPAPVGAPTSPVYRSACVGAGLTWRSLGRSLRAFVSACAAQLLLQPGALRFAQEAAHGAAAAAASSPTRYYKQKTNVYKGSSASRL